jgi:hypothetical protein
MIRTVSISHKELCTFMVIFRLILLRMRNFADKRNSEHILFSTKIFPKFVPFMRLCGKIQWHQRGHGRQYNTMQKRCALLLDNKGYKHTLRICNTYFFSVPTIVTRTHRCGNLKMACICYSVKC